MWFIFCKLIWSPLCCSGSHYSNVSHDLFWLWKKCALSCPYAFTVLDRDSRGSFHIDILRRRDSILPSGFKMRDFQVSGLGLIGNEIWERINCDCQHVWGTPLNIRGASKVVLEVKNPSAMQETQETKVWSPGQEDPLEKAMATHSSILA